MTEKNIIANYDVEEKGKSKSTAMMFFKLYIYLLKINLVIITFIVFHLQLYLSKTIVKITTLIMLILLAVLSSYGTKLC
jgi:hypothetical protein